jgi:excisionase family DNA binding protein
MDELMQPLAVRIREACRMTGISRSKLYELIGSGEIERIKVGSITLIPIGSLRLFIDRRRAVAQPDCRSDRAAQLRPPMNAT